MAGFAGVAAIWLAIHLVRQTGAVIVLWLYKGLPVPAPGKFVALVALPIVAFALYASLRPIRPPP